MSRYREDKLTQDISMNNICNNCRNKVVLHALSVGECIYCKEETPTGHIPANKVCKSCANHKEVCEQCGEKPTKKL